LNVYSDVYALLAVAIFFLCDLYIFSAIRSFALLALGFLLTSSSEGMIGLPVIFFISAFLPHTQTGNSLGQVHGFARLLNISFTILSSREWKVMMHSLPPGDSMSQKFSTALWSCPSSSLTSILMA